MIYELFRATRAFEAVQSLSDLFNARLQIDDVHDFDTRWDQAPLAASEIPTEMVLEVKYKSQLQEEVALQEQENIPTKQFHISKTSHGSDDENSKLLKSGAMLSKADQSPRVKKGRQASVDRKVGGGN